MNRRRAIAALAASAAAYPFRVSGSQARVLPWSDLEPLPPRARARYTDLARIARGVVPNGAVLVRDPGE
ncbi:MAG: hypothetical protein F4228_11760, partial [Acidobacteria bacterium]|nr:hypothetical protein [Acidobacteriota bacterium]